MRTRGDDFYRAIDELLPFHILEIQVSGWCMFEQPREIQFNGSGS